MNYRAAFREIITSDLGRNCPVAPDPGDFEIHLRAISQDLAAIERVTRVSFERERVLFIETDEQELQVIKSKLKPILQHHYDFLRLLTIVAV